MSVTNVLNRPEIINLSTTDTLLSRLDDSLSAYSITWTQQYTQAQYIESTSTQHIYTGYKPGPNTRIMCKYQATALVTNNMLLKSTISSSANSLCFLLSGQNNNANLGGIVLGPTWSSSATFTPDLNEHFISMDCSTGTIFIDTTSYTLQPLSATTTESLILFANSCKARIFYLKIYESNTLVMDLTPCRRKLDGIVGLYDKVNNIFFDNNYQGSGVFLSDIDNKFEIGKDVSTHNISSDYQEVSYIQSTGYQSINTGINGTTAYGFYLEFMPTYLNQGWQSYLSGVLDNFTIGSFGELAKCYLRIANAEISRNYTTETTKYNKVSYNNGIINWNDTITNLSNRALANQSGNIILFNNTGLSRYSSCRVKILKLYDEDGIMICYLVPCYRKSDNVSGMYDILRGQFYTN